MNSSSSEDSTARQIAQTEFDRPVAVEAGAGTGKTTVLVSRILAWVLARGWDRARHEVLESSSETQPDPSRIDDRTARKVMEGVVAITFTEAAAAQMATRVAQTLARLASDPESPVVGFDRELLPGDPDAKTLSRRAVALIGALDHLRVRTIHSFCWQLLTSHALTAQISPDLEVDADGRHLEEIARRRVEDAFREVFRAPDRYPLGRLALRGIDPNQTVAAIGSLIGGGVSAPALAADPFDSERTSEWIRGLQLRLQSAAEMTARFAGNTKARNAARIFDAVETSLKSIDLESPDHNRHQLGSTIEKVKSTWNDALLTHLRKWARGQYNATESDAIGSDASQLAAVAAELVHLLQNCRESDMGLLDDARLALAPLIADIENDLRRQGLATYSHLLTEAWRLITGSSAVRRREQSRIEQLLVDEFQDTDQLQCALIRALGLEGPREQRPGLFVVGDPKQSIYGWRNADLSAYSEFMTALEGAGGVTCRLDRNFRSLPPILEEIDRSIAPIMKPVSGLQPAFHSLRSGKKTKDSSVKRPLVEYWVSWGLEDDSRSTKRSKTSADDAAQIEADAIAADIAAVHQSETTPWSDFALLLRSTGRLEIFLDAFRRAGVPFVVGRDKHYYRRREIIDVVALIRTIVHPVDHLALVAFLRSPTVGMPDAALLPLWQRRFPALVTELSSHRQAEMEEIREMVFEVADTIPKEIPGIERIQGWELSVVDAIETLAKLREAWDLEPADRFIEQVRQLLLPEVTEASRYLGRYRLANLDRFFRRLEASLEERAGDIGTVLRTLKRSVDELEVSEQALPEGATESGVQVMTIHGAKGLEFGHVYLPQLHARGGSSVATPVRFDRRWIPGKCAEYALFGAPTLGFGEVQIRDQQIDAAEQVRTLYVAMTRAKERLVLAGNWSTDPTDPNPSLKETFAGLLGSRTDLPDSLDSVLEECVAEGRSSVDIGPTRWRFPAFDRSELQSQTPRSMRKKQPILSADRLSADQLRQLHEDASRLMSRPFSATPSEEAAESLEPLLRSEKIEAADPAVRGGVGRLVGTSFHRMMERWDLDATPEAELERQIEIQVRWLRRQSGDDRHEEAETQFRELTDRFEGSRIWERFVGLRSAVVGREVPVILPPDRSTLQPLGYVAGSIDLVARDDQGRFTVIDFKTDAIEQPEEIRLRAEAYHRQEMLYATALAESLDLGDLPDCQLWFIWPDHLWNNSDPTPS